MSKKENDEEVLLDITKIKNFFKGKNKDKHSKSENGFDFKQIRKYAATYGIVLLILIPMFFAIWFRAYPAYLPITDTWAESNVYNYYRGQISSQINAQYPNLPDANKQTLIESELSKFIKSNKQVLEQNIKQTSEGFKQQFQDSTGQTYLLAIDPYFYLRNMENVLEHGFESDVEKNGCYYDTHAGAPVKIDETMSCKGQKKIQSFHTWFEVTFYKVWHFFNRDVTPLKAAFYVPLIIAALAVIPAFFLARKIGGNIAGFFSAMIVALHSSFLTRTPAGFADTDAYNVTIPLFIIWLFIGSIYSKDKYWKIGLGIASGLLTGVYSLAWGGWWYIFDFILISIFGYVIYHIIIAIRQSNKNWKAIWSPQLKMILLTAAAFIISASIFIPLLSNWDNFLYAPLQPLKFSSIKDVATVTLWPNVFTTVAELNPASLPQIIQTGGMGKLLLFTLGLVGLILSLPKRGRKISKVEKKFMIISIIWYILLIYFHKSITDVVTFVFLMLLPIGIGFLLPIIFKEVEFNIEYAIFLAIWLGGTVYASTKGVRFLLILVPAISIAIGIAVGIIYRFLTKWISKELKINELLTKIVIALLFLMILITPIKSANSIALQEIPSFNDAWHTALIKINQNSSEDAIVNSWWDFGHWFKYWTDRGVTLDGGIQNRPQAHWLGRLMQTDNEIESMGILRMLDCGTTAAFDKLFEYTNKDFLKSINTLKEIIVLDKQQAAKILKENGFTKDQTKVVLENTHCQPPEDFFITSEDMVGKAGVWAHFGSWNFTKAGMYNKVKDAEVEAGKNILMKDFGLDLKEAEKIYYEVQTQDANNWVSPWPGYVSGIVGCTMKGTTKISCPQVIQGGQRIPLEIDLITMDAKVAGQNKISPKSLVYITENGTKEKFFDGTTFEVSVILIPNKNNAGFATLMVHPLLANSIFTKMFYLDGHGLKHFDKFDDRRSVTGQRIITWKVDWQGSSTNKIFVKAPEKTSVKKTPNNKTTNNTNNTK